MNWVGVIYLLYGRACIAISILYITYLKSLIASINHCSLTYIHAVFKKKILNNMWSCRYEYTEYWNNVKPIKNRFREVWRSKWASHLATTRRQLVKTINMSNKGTTLPLFFSINLPRIYFYSLSRLGFGHNHLSHLLRLYC